MYISNHQSSGKILSIFNFLQSRTSLVDWIVANILAIRQGSLGHIRYVLKSDLKWIPLYGFYFQHVKSILKHLFHIRIAIYFSTDVFMFDEMIKEI